MYCVYKHTSPSGKVYIGITGCDPKNRWKANGLGYKGQTVFWRAIEKYGWSNFKHEIIESELSLEDALRLEAEYISRYDSNNPERGYNRNSGGFGNIGRIFTEEDRARLSEAKKNPSEETRKRISEAGKGRRHSDETKLKMSQSRTGHNTSFETRKKISKALKNCIVSEETKAKRAEALRQHYINGGTNTNVGRQRSEETKRKISETKRRLKQGPSQKAIESRKDKGIPVRCIETGEIYPTMKSASLALGLSKNRVVEVIRGKYKTAGGYHWELVEVVGM